MKKYNEKSQKEAKSITIYIQFTWPGTDTSITSGGIKLVYGPKLPLSVK
jgi:hypothetical protein